DPFGLYCCTLNDAANFAAGFGDFVSFGLTDKVRDLIDANGVVDKGSGAYVGGEITGAAVTVAADAAALVGKGGARVVEEGIYQFTATSGKTYVGQSGRISARLAEHVREGRLAAQEVGNVMRTEVRGGKLAREIAEQRRIDELGGIASKTLENVRNAIGKARRYLMGTP